MGNDTQMDDLHTRMMRVTEDLRAIQRELNYSAMQAPSDPELMEALSALPETEAIQVLTKSLDQMRHFLWFYTQVMSNDPELGDKLRQSNASQAVEEGYNEIQHAKLNELAARTGRGTEELVQEAVDRMLDYDRWFKEQVQVGLDQIARGELIDEEEMDARVERMFQN